MFLKNIVHLSCPRALSINFGLWNNYVVNPRIGSPDMIMIASTQPVVAPAYLKSLECDSFAIMKQTSIGWRRHSCAKMRRTANPTVLHTLFFMLLCPVFNTGKWWLLSMAKTINQWGRLALVPRPSTPPVCAMQKRREKAKNHLGTKFISELTLWRKSMTSFAISLAIMA